MANERGFADRDDPHTLTLTHDEVLILQDFLEWLEETDGLKYRHPAEWTALGRIMGQLLPPLWEVFDPRYNALLAEAKSRYSQTFEGNVPGIGYVKVEEDGSVVQMDDPDAPQA
jgi:hypothetical protein